MSAQLIICLRFKSPSSCTFLYVFQDMHNLGSRKIRVLRHIIAAHQASGI